MVIGGGTKQNTPITAGKGSVKRRSKKRISSGVIKKRIPSSLSSTIVKEGDYVIQSSVLSLFKVKLDDPNISLSQIQTSAENKDDQSFNLNCNNTSNNKNNFRKNSKNNHHRNRIANLKRKFNCFNKKKDKDQLKIKTDNNNNNNNQQHPLRRNVTISRNRRRKKLDKENLNKSRKNIVRVSLPKTRLASMDGKCTKSFSLSARKNQINKAKQMDAIASFLKQKQTDSSPMVNEMPPKQSSVSKERSNSRKVASFDDNDCKFSYQDKVSRKLLQSLCAPKKVADKSKRTKKKKKKEISQKLINPNISKQLQISKTQVPEQQPPRQPSIVPNGGKELMLDMIASDVPTVLIAPGDYQHIYKFMNKNTNETSNKSEKKPMNLALANGEKKQQRKVYRIPSDAPTVLVEVMEKAKKITENDINDWKVSHFLRNQKEMSSKNTSIMDQSGKSSEISQSFISPIPKDSNDSKEMIEPLSQEVSKNIIESIKSPFDPGCLKKPIFPPAMLPPLPNGNQKKFSIFEKCCESCSIF